MLGIVLGKEIKCAREIFPSWVLLNLIPLIGSIILIAWYAEPIKESKIDK